MSPVAGILLLVFVIGAIVLCVGVVRRKRAFILIGLPFAALLAWWFVSAGRAPDPDAEFIRWFGKENRAVVSDVKTIKPVFMDGHFMSFHISQADFDKRIKSGLGASTAPPGSLLQRQALPKGWPDWIKIASPAVKGAALDNQIFIVYGPKEETIFASVVYEQW
jgi:hypothetical protein